MGVLLPWHRSSAGGIVSPPALCRRRVPAPRYSLSPLEILSILLFRWRLEAPVAPFLGSRGCFDFQHNLVPGSTEINVPERFHQCATSRERDDFTPFLSGTDPSAAFPWAAPVCRPLPASVAGGGMSEQQIHCFIGPNDAIQRDLDRLERWDHANLMKFSQAKCKVLHLGHSSPSHKSRLGGERMGSSPEEKGFGVVVDEKLNTSQLSGQAERVGGVQPREEKAPGRL
ncbi:hypothetical protein llap_6572 [Limosa lapponica baueri]|uniref:Rna-directed dna polymerase from mobile element jockey-like n=1 Tax=Limosa lapponica baueri TaxID=1758121 RepID=A0A2I0UAP2_LIMLA|nr:hypothetical protein llap_6572 [Limosa lapponica baueri]